MLASLTACGDDDPSIYATGIASETSTLESDDGTKFDMSPELDLENASEAGGDPCKGTGSATLTGTVYAPNLVLPISDALVWVSQDPPEPIPNLVYCNECVELECLTPYERTAADGSFELELDPGTLC